MPASGYTNSKHTHIYSLNFADDQVLLAQDHDDVEYMARKLKEEYEKWGLNINLEKNKYICMGERKEILKFERRRRNKAVYRMYLFSHENKPVRR